MAVKPRHWRDTEGGIKKSDELKLSQIKLVVRILNEYKLKRPTRSKLLTQLSRVYSEHMMWLRHEKDRPTLAEVREALRRTRKQVINKGRNIYEALDARSKEFLVDALTDELIVNSDILPKGFKSYHQLAKHQLSTNKDVLAETIQVILSKIKTRDKAEADRLLAINIAYALQANGVKSTLYIKTNYNSRGGLFYSLIQQLLAFGREEPYLNYNVTHLIDIARKEVLSS